MNKLVVLALILNIGIAYSQNPLNHLYNDVSDGVYEEFYSNGNVRIQCFVINGNLDGEHKTYFRNGDLNSVENFRNGKFYGQNLEYDKSGNIINDAYHKNDSLISYTEFNFHKSNILKSERSIIVDKDTAGLNTFDNAKNQVLSRGIVYNIETVINSLKSSGFYREFYESGEIKTLEPLVNNERSGTCYMYYKNGDTMYEYNCKNGYFHGKYISYGKDGSILKTEIWNEGKKLSEINE